LLLPIAWAGGTVALVLSDNTPHFREFASTFSESLQGSGWKIGKTDDTPQPRLIITVGVDAFRKSLARGSQTPIIAVLIGRQLYEKLLAESGRPRHLSTAIYIEQPISRQVAFLRQILPGYNRLGILLSDEGKEDFRPLRQALLSNGFSVDNEDSNGEETLIPAINALLPRVQLLLATPDPKIYRRDNVKTILITTYRHQKPLIAFSSTFVTAGALAALYSTPQQIARQAAELLINNDGELAAPEYPTQFSVAINRSVAEALNLPATSEAEIRRALMAKESR
jgi:ABC-type uncharacterized transport system substrate-binding protein